MQIQRWVMKVFTAETQRALRKESFSFAVETRPPRLSGSRWRAGAGKGKQLSSIAAGKSTVWIVFVSMQQISRVRQDLRILAFRPLSEKLKKQTSLRSQRL
jgi:hypothetical protein